MELKTLTADNYELAFMERGHGTPLVLIHGSLSDYRSWALQIKNFSKNFRTIALSLPHIYLKPLKANKDCAVILQQAYDLSLFIKKLKAGPVNLVGHSRGGALALILAAEHPELFRSVVLADPAPFDSIIPNLPEVLVELRKRKSFIIEAIDHIKKGELDIGLEIFTDAVSTKGNWKKLPEAGKQIRRENALSLKNLISDGQVSFTSKDAGKIDMPVLLVTGEKSPLIYGIMHTALENHLKNFKKIQILKASHGMHRDNPNSFNTAVLDFLIKHNDQEHKSDDMKRST